MLVVTPNCKMVTGRQFQVMGDGDGNKSILLRLNIVESSNRVYEVHARFLELQKRIWQCVYTFDCLPFLFFFQ